MDGSVGSRNESATETQVSTHGPELILKSTAEQLRLTPTNDSTVARLDSNKDSSRSELPTRHRRQCRRDITSSLTTTLKSQNINDKSALVPLIRAEQRRPIGCFGGENELERDEEYERRPVFRTLIHGLLDQLGMTANAEAAAEKTEIFERNVGESSKTHLPKAVVAPEFLAEDVPLRDAWVGTLREKRDISTAIRNITSIIPGTTHLKRCSGKRLIIAFAMKSSETSIDTSLTDNNEKSFNRQELEHLLSRKDFDLSIFEKEFDIIRVPAESPKTKAQAMRASKIWPLNFHPDPFVENTISGTCFNSSDLDVIDRCMEACIEAATREAHGNDDCNGSATIFDPIEGKIVALAASRLDRHPMWHATMLAIDLVAKLRNGGAYELTNLDDSSLIVSTGCNTRKRKHSENEKDVEPPLAYPPSLFEIVRRHKFSSVPTGRENSSAFLDGTKETLGQADNYNGAYLCTNYWVFLLREPCAMCAMALVHSRVSNIFYGIRNENRGVLGSRALLHTLPGLNHRYRVWRGIREEQCQNTYNQISNRWQSKSDST